MNTTESAALTLTARLTSLREQVAGVAVAYCREFTAAAADVSLVAADLGDDDESTAAVAAALRVTEVADRAGSRVPSRGLRVDVLRLACLNLGTAAWDGQQYAEAAVRLANAAEDARVYVSFAGSVAAHVAEVVAEARRIIDRLDAAANAYRRARLAMLDAERALTIDREAA